jgi:excisionase family DNA binding protein
MMLTAPEVALWLSVPTRRVEQMARNGEIPSVALPTDDLLFDRAELLAWLNSLRGRPQEVSCA